MIEPVMALLPWVGDPWSIRWFNEVVTDPGSVLVFARGWLRLVVRPPPSATH